MTEFGHGRARRLVPRAGLLDAEVAGDDVAANLTRQEVAEAWAAVSVLRHVATYQYSVAITRMEHRLVVIPRRHHGDQQRVEHRFRVLVDDEKHPTQLHTRTDRFGNTIVDIHAHSVDRQIQFETRAVVSRVAGDDAPHWHEPGVDPRTDLTDASADLRRSARDADGAGSATERARRLMAHVAEQFTYGKGATTVKTSAAEAWDLKQGVCQDMAHVLIAMLTEVGIPARYVSGHLVGEGASHAWIEALDPATGVVTAFDPTHDRVTDLRYVTVAVGRDYSDVSPTAGTVWADTASGGKLQIEKQFRVVDAYGPHQYEEGRHR